MLPLEHPDRLQIAFDDHRLVNNAGLLLPATLAQHVGLHVPNCELFAGKSRYKESSLVGWPISTVKYPRPHLRGLLHVCMQCPSTVSSW